MTPSSRLRAFLSATTIVCACSRAEVVDGGEQGAGGGGAGGGAGGGSAGSNGGSGESGGRSAGGSSDGGTGGAGAPDGGRAASGGGSIQAGGQPGAGGAGGSGAGGGPTASGGATLDVFGIKKLYPSDPTLAEWTSAHYDRNYEVAFRTDDEDPSRLSGARGDGTLTVFANGELIMSGSQPRLYINEDPGHSWRDVEITVYYQRVNDSAAAYAGLVVGARSGPEGHSTDGACDAHTYYARVRNDGAFDFEKELKHPASATKSRVDPEEAWPPNGEVPRETWIGWKFILYNLEDGAVQLEAYRDLTGGANGGDWELVNETIDDGGWFVETDCAEHDPEDGESDLVVEGSGSILIRNTDVVEARYRAISVRAIQAP